MTGQEARDDAVHWVGDAPTSLHGNGAGSFARATRDPAAVTCPLCRTLLEREARDERPLTPCGNIVCTGCRICGCPALGIAPQEARDDERDTVAAAIAKAADGDYWVDEIREWEDAEDWEREAHPNECPHSAYEDREFYRKQADAALAVLARKHPEPETAEPESVTSSSHRTIAVAFLRLPWTSRQGIIDSLGLRQDADRDLPRDSAWVEIMMTRVREAGAVDALAAALRVPVGEGEQETHAAPVAGERIPGDELIVDSPSYSVRRLLSALDGIETSDEEFSTAAEFVDAGGTITIRDSQGFPLYELRIQGNPTSEEEMPDA